jgi:SPP1 family phage portal protein
MKVEEIFKRADLSVTQQIELLKKQRENNGVPMVNVEEGNKYVDEQKHDVMNPALRRDKWVTVDDPNDIEAEGGAKRLEPVNRIPIAYQKLIISRSVAFLFGNDVQHTYPSVLTDKQQQIIDAIEKISKANKISNQNRMLARTAMTYKEAAELWYVRKEKNTDYGFNSEFKLKSKVLDPNKGYIFYPYYDFDGDLIAFSFSFYVQEGTKKINYFETWTSDQQIRWTDKGGTWELMEGFPTVNTIGKIPIAFVQLDEYETEDVQHLINRLEKLLSNFADTNDYHASPTIVVKGEVKGFAKKGESGKILELVNDASAEYLSWSNAPESVKLEIETLIRMISTIAQSPDISFDSLKGIGSISGTALNVLMTDAHLKVMKHAETFEPFLQRRINIIKAYVKTMNLELASEIDSLYIEPYIIPFSINNESDKIELLLKANGNVPLISQKASMQQAGMTNNPEQDYEQYLRENDENTTSEVKGLGK